MKTIRFLSQKVNYKRNNLLTDDEKTAYNTSSVTSFAIQDETSRELNISGLSKPINFSLKSSQSDVKQIPIELSLPGQIYYANVSKIDSDCNMIVTIGDVNKNMRNITERQTIELSFFIKIGQVPTIDNYDLRQDFKVISGAGVESFTKLNFTTNNNNNNTNGIFKELGLGSVLISNFSLMWNKQRPSIRDIRANTSIHFALLYTGMLPPIEHIPNDYTYDLLDRRSKFKVRLRAYCAMCKYWNEANLKWQSDGVEVSVRLKSMSDVICFLHLCSPQISSHPSLISKAEFLSSLQNTINTD